MEPQKRDSTGKFLPRKKVNQIETDPEETTSEDHEQQTQITTPMSDLNNDITEEHETVEQTTSEGPSLSPTSSNSLLDDMLMETDKDNEEEREEDFEEEESEEEASQEEPKTNIPPKKDFAQKLSDTITTEAEDWENPQDRKKAASAEALLKVTVGSMALGFLGQVIEGDYSPEAEMRYTPSEERQEAIRKPYAKVLELKKRTKPLNPKGELISALVLTVIPIAVNAFKRRKQKQEHEEMKLQIETLKKQLAEAQKNNSTTTQTETSSENNTTKQTTSEEPAAKQNNKKPFMKTVHNPNGAGRHPNNCSCYKCTQKRLKKTG